MKALSFNEMWKKLIIACFSTITYLVIVNEKSRMSFTPSKGLRQENLLSPYLFLIYVEGHSVLINNVERRGDITGSAVTRGGTSISHLLFTDDSFLFCRANTEKWVKIRNILDINEKGLGQAVNIQKFSICFSPNTLEVIKKSILEEVRGTVCSNYNMYLSLLTLIGQA